MAVAIVVAAGRGTRLGHERPKALVPLAGRPLLAWSLEALLAVPDLRRVVVALPAGEALPADPARWGLAPRAFAPLPGTDEPRVVAVAGGRERSHSVRAALAATGDGPDDEPVVVQDGARPLTTPALVDACLAGVHAGADAAIAAAPVTDTVKQAHPDRPGAGLARVAATLDRSLLWAVQTPQAFRRDALRRALDQPDAVLAAATDDASLVEAAGGDVRLVPAPRSNLKVTVPEDLELATLLLARDDAPTVAG
ncbi:2-C-methyl-D-erythritol 4-phosphate cytidylyltransferase [Patulibacter brassicae]|uniref:2-C-methyl-D-erythritol 4-phosphate cytidylyltransferase n=1 Tax=Patulibacter brassicae TaxID=1705717 RepID=A0ABU4VMH8_9ACTN|nr:2-C-methyl-D-erythritol 4-phosphate cytidylyltransferase [Patulibacter brassicae]MDX8153051.1 2-C-methyl-D-erythritol 4-phosphate cytidylyltransferase [Patulibacter brassicae]